MSSASPVPGMTVEQVPDPVPAHLVVLDVREPDEWVAGHAPGAIHIPLRALPEHLAQLPPRRVLVVCHVGARSALATAFLLRQGVDAVNLIGGMEAWAVAGRPLVSETGGPAAVI